MDRKFKQIGNGIFAPESVVCMNIGSTHKREICQIVLICVYCHHHIIIIITTLPLRLNIYGLGWLVKRPWSGRRRRMPARLTTHLVFNLTVIIVIIVIIVNVIIINFSPSLLDNVEAF